MGDTKIKYFYCRKCKFAWESDEYLTPGAKSVAACPQPDCGVECPECIPQVYTLFKSAWPKATGPKTKAGKDRVRLNGWKHGLTAQPHLLPPAKPGKFPECKNCDEIEACKAGEYKYCIKQVYTIAHYLEAYESGDVDKMRGLAATTQAKTKAVLDRVLNHILEHGVMLKEQLFDPEGNPLTSASGQPAVRYVKNALLKELQPLIKIVGFEATEQLMTPKSAEEQEALTGHLAATQTEQEDLRGFREKMEADRERLLRIMEQNEQKSNKSGGAGGEGDSALSG